MTGCRRVCTASGVHAAAAAAAAAGGESGRRESGVGNFSTCLQKTASREVYYVSSESLFLWGFSTVMTSVTVDRRQLGSLGKIRGRGLCTFSSVCLFSF